ncbi:U6 snRNA-associated Sm-like protein LSm1 isoform X1 [Gallus gallus]|uniref:U6 snRNA-associated Sm-like protein LSm1 isoform X1 n=1 Tax=Gallus gallus TaxID=9031 RepID=UPI001EFFB165|nr:U6 snRNA-associated Sm-like protein LSm1 isoform X1 [Gallus gallus]XP_046787656.1 U6 snRNA-associated Sm-like protein LSm1 isoform X1 [Gallus gallus]
MNYMPGTASLIQDIDSECDRGSVGTAGNEGETPRPATGRPDADRIPAQHRSVRKSGAASDRGAHSRGQEVWGHPPRDLRREGRERGAAGGDRPGEGERHAAAAGVHRGDPGGAARGAAGQAGVGEAEGAGAEGARPGGAQG